MRHFLKSLSKKTGLPPGTAAHIGSFQKNPISMSLLTYNSNYSHYNVIDDVKTIKVKKEYTQWIDINGIHDVNKILQLGHMFNIHKLVLEDITNTSQLPKIEETQFYIFIIIKAISFENNTIQFEHINFYLAPHYVMSFQENNKDVFETVRSRIINKNDKVFEKKEDYLLYSLFDYVIDTYFETLRKIDERLSELNNEVDVTPSQQTLINIQTLKKQILLLKRYFWYTRDIILHLKKSESLFISPKTRKYLTDLHDHIAHIIDISESFREEITDLIERHLSAVSFRSNDIMKTLTIVAAMFMPLTFFVGLYGMNFVHMPELHYRWSYPIFLIFLFLLATILFFYFKKKKWFE